MTEPTIPHVVEPDYQALTRPGAELTHYGVPMRLQPVNLPSLEAVAEILINGQPVAVHLEPGDATRYEVLLVPITTQMNRLMRYEVRDARGMFLVQRLNGIDNNPALWLHLDRLHTNHQRSKLQAVFPHPWTSVVWTWWLSQLAFVLRQRWAFIDEAEQQAAFARQGDLTWRPRLPR